jgi:hypothetical protein
MPCYNTVTISIIPPTSQGVGPLVWQNGSQINRLNIPQNPSLVVYDGSVTRFGDGSIQAPIYLPAVQQVSGIANRYLGADSNGQLGYYPFNNNIGIGTANQILATNGSATATVWQTGIVGVSGTVTAATSGFVGETLSWSSGNITFTTGQAQELLTITSGSSPALTNGDWQFSAVFLIICTNVSIIAGASFVAGISTSTGIPALSNRLQFPMINAVSGGSFTIEVPSPTLNVIQNSGTVYAFAQAPAFTATSVQIGCYLTARRMR